MYSYKRSILEVQTLEVVPSFTILTIFRSNTLVRVLSIPFYFLLIARKTVIYDEEAIKQWPLTFDVLK